MNTTNEDIMNTKASIKTAAGLLGLPVIDESLLVSEQFLLFSNGVSAKPKDTGPDTALTLYQNTFTTIIEELCRDCNVSPTGHQHQVAIAACAREVRARSEKSKENLAALNKYREAFHYLMKESRLKDHVQGETAAVDNPSSESLRRITNKAWDAHESATKASVYNNLRAIVNSRSEEWKFAVKTDEGAVALVLSLVAGAAAHIKIKVEEHDGVFSELRTAKAALGLEMVSESEKIVGYIEQFVEAADRKLKAAGVIASTYHSERVQAEQHLQGIYDSITARFPALPIELDLDVNTTEHAKVKLLVDLLIKTADQQVEQLYDNFCGTDKLARAAEDSLIPEEDGQPDVSGIVQALSSRIDDMTTALDTANEKLTSCKTEFNTAFNAAAPEFELGPSTMSDLPAALFGKYKIATDTKLGEVEKQRDTLTQPALSWWDGGSGLYACVWRARRDQARRLRRVRQGRACWSQRDTRHRQECHRRD
jgi:hypothetical protein